MTQQQCIIVNEIGFNTLVKKLKMSLNCRCITCLNEFSKYNLRRHLKKHRDHIHSLKTLKTEKENVFKKLDKSPDEMEKAKLVFAVKYALLISI